MRLAAARFLLLLPLLLPAPAAAVLIALPDGSANTTAPVPDPGWSHVGTKGSLSVVHIGDGWILTANHVGAGDVMFGGVSYSHVPGTEVRLSNPDASLADLLLFAVYPPPPTPWLSIADVAPSVGTPITMIGYGRNRGAATSYDPNGPPPPGPISGWEWGPGRTMRWGSNHVEEFETGLVLGTWSFTSFFDSGTGTHEAQATNGDSGGAVFAWDGSGWELVGLMYAIGEFSWQAADTSFFGQPTYSVDLAVYHDEIVATRNLPEPAGALRLGVVLVLALARRRGRTGASA